jgi:hypothetical protein
VGHLVREARVEMDVFFLSLLLVVVVLVLLVAVVLAGLHEARRKEKDDWRPACTF